MFFGAWNEGLLEDEHFEGVITVVIWSKIEQNILRLLLCVIIVHLVSFCGGGVRNDNGKVISLNNVLRKGEFIFYISII